MELFFSFDPSSSSFTKLKDFDGTNGAAPHGSLIQASNGKLYGMTSGGGSSELGIIFSYDPSSSTYTKLKDFDSANGVNPYGSLIQASDGILYGMTPYGGRSGQGVIFSFDPSSSNYTKLKDFDGANGAAPSGSLIEASDGKLYGMTISGGSNGFGVIFSFEPSSSTYTKRKVFDLFADGGSPFGSLMQASDGKLYGMTSGGGSQGDGVIFSYDPSSSTFTKLKDFVSDNGMTPLGSLMQASDGNLYGMTIEGGIIGHGVVFSFDPSTSTYTKLKDFGSNESGSSPYSSLMQANDGKIYGMTSGGGSQGCGVIFSFDPSSSTYTKLKDFDYFNGASPHGSLMQASNGKLYGMTSGGGSQGCGFIFSFDPSSSTFTKLKDFDYFNGASPHGSLMQASNGKLYGMTYEGGSRNFGVIFSYDPSSSSYTKLKNFDGTNGANPYGSFIQASNGKLYGMTYEGGSSSEGVTFSFDPSSSTYTKLKDFDRTNGANPKGSLIQASDGKLYGMTMGGGGDDKGIIFSYDPSSLTYQKLKDFDSTNGYNPQGTLLQASDGKLYGMTKEGGSNNKGIIFSFDPSSLTYTKLKDFDGTNGSSPSIGSAFIEVKDKQNKPPTVFLSIPNNILKYTGPATFKLEAAAKDSDGTITKVEFYNGITLLYTETVIPYGYWWKGVPVGNYTLTAKAYDNSGNVTTSNAIKVSVVNYNVPPVVRIVTPVNSQTISEHATFRFGVSAKDPNDKITTVKFYSGTTLLHTETVIPYGYWWHDIKAGNYTITAVATDDKGLSATSAPVHFTVVPNKVPTVNIITPANYKTFTGPATINIEAVAKDADGTISKVEFYNGKTLLTTERLLPYTYSWKNVSVGNYAITAKAYDKWGVVTTSAVINVSVIPNIAPTVSIINPANEESFIAPATIPLVASAVDADGKISKVEFYNGKTLLTTEKLVPYTYYWTNVAAGTYSITAIATDDKGLKTTSAPIKVIVTAQGALTVSRRPVSADSKTGANNRISLKLYPNPASNVINIHITGLEVSKPSTISIISSLGVVIKTMQLNASKQAVPVDVSSLGSGAYIVKILSGDKVMYKHFVKL